jgi:hypothetical protein
MSETVTAFFAALAKRRINLKTAAYLGGGHVKMLERLQRGETRTLDAAYVARLAAKIEDGAAFLAEVFGSPAADPLAAIRADLAAIKQAVTPKAAPSAYWFDERGRQFAAIPDLETAARLALNLPPSVDAAAFAQRNLGWVAVQDGALVPNASAAEDASTAAHAFLRAAAPDTLPRGWRASAKPIGGDVRPEIKRLVSAAGIGDIRDALQGAQLLDRASVYAVEPDRITTIWLGSDLKTSADAIGSTLASRNDRPFAGMLERQIRDTAAAGAQLWHLADIQTCGVRATYERVAVPTADRRFVAHVVAFKAIERTSATVPTAVRA